VVLQTGPQPSPVTPAVIDLSVVVPAYNEQQRLGACVDTVCAYLRGSGCSWELIVVDDGSSDGTAAIAAGRARLEPRITLIRLPTNSGKGYAVRAGVLASRGRDVLISDADLSTPIDELELLRARRNGAVVAIGSRALPASRIEARQGAVREALGRFGNRLIQTVAVRGFADTQCGFKLFNGRAARAVFAVAKLNGWAFDVEILHLCVRFGWPVVEVPVRWGHSPGSKVRPSAYLHVLTEIAQLRLAHRRTRAPQLDPESPPTSARQAPEHHI
jgi:glycosyltransferase involved in cell wall biosynthesis